MEVVKYVITAASFLGSLAGIFNAVKGWILTPPGDRRKVLKGIRTAAAKASVVIAVLLAAVVSGVNVWEVVRFGISTDPLTRGAVLMLLVNIWNSMIYLFFATVILVTKAAIKRRDMTYAIHSQT